VREPLPPSPPFPPSLVICVPAMGRSIMSCVVD
jgi:hypothetical protein